MNAKLEYLASPSVVTTRTRSDKAHIVFVAAEDGTTGVVKHCPNALAEAFGLLLAAPLGVSSPCVRVVDRGRSLPSLLMERVGGAVEMSSLTGEFIYRYILCESCSRFDLPPLIYYHFKTSRHRSSRTSAGPVPRG